MEDLHLIHLSGPLRGAASPLPQLPASIGSDPGNLVILPGIAPHHAELLLHEGQLVLRDAGSGQDTFVDGRGVTESVVHDGDLIQLGPEGPKLRLRAPASSEASFMQALRWARPDGPADSLADTATLLRVIAWETKLRTSMAFRMTLAVILPLILALAAALVWWGREESARVQAELRLLQDELKASRAERSLEREAFEARIAEERRRGQLERAGLEERVEEYRQREAALRTDLATATGSDVLALRAELATSQDRLRTLEEENAVGARIIREFGTGVALIQGSYAFYDAEARPLRLSVGPAGRPLMRAPGVPVLEVDANGPIHTVDYFGTAFLADKRGLLLTNRHVAEPWWNDALADVLEAQGFRPRFVLFRAFFPKESEPFALEPERVSADVDLALLRIDGRLGDVPVLPLDTKASAAVAGEPVVVVGYPTGIEAILAKTDGRVVEELLREFGPDAERVTEALAARGLIRPSTTQGHIGDITPTDVVFDAPTTQGGSGGPVFNRQGRVVAVEYAVLEKFGGNSFGVPIRYAVELLRGKRTQP